MNTQTTSSILEFKGLGDWFEIFEGGPQTASNGNQVNFGDHDLDEIIENTKRPVPLVVGHPKTNSPSYGWSHALKREGNKLFARAKDYAQEFSDAVQAKHFPERSISLGKTPEGKYYVRHIGFLGAAAPAIKTLAGIEFNDADEVIEFNFGEGDEGKSDKGEGDENVGIAQQMMEFCRQFLPDQSQNSTNDKPNVPEREQSVAGNAEFNEPNDEETTVPDDLQATQAENERLKEQIKQNKLDMEAMKFQAQKDAATVQINQMLDKGVLLPANTKGDQLAEFCAWVNTQDAELDFSDSNGATVKQSPAVFFNEFMNSLGVQVENGRDGNDEPDKKGETVADFHGHDVDSERLDFAVRAEQLAAEKNISFASAAILLERGEK